MRNEVLSSLSFSSTRQMLGDRSEQSLSALLVRMRAGRRRHPHHACTMYCRLSRIGQPRSFRTLDVGHRFLRIAAENSSHVVSVVKALNSDLAYKTETTTTDTVRQ
jgi:hypothetical protein